MPRTMPNNELWTKLSAILRQNGLYAKQSMHLVVQGIFYRMHTGCPWRDLPAIQYLTIARLTAGLRKAFPS